MFVYQRVYIPPKKNCTQSPIQNKVVPPSSKLEAGNSLHKPTQLALEHHRHGLDFAKEHQGQRAPAVVWTSVVGGLGHCGMTGLELVAIERC